MQWIAIITMIVDHIGITFFPDSPMWRIVGRLAFPIYTYYVAIGMMRTRNRPRYLRRLAMLAILSQLPFSLLFGVWTVNVIGTFFLSVASIYMMERTPSRSLRFFWPIAAVILMEFVSFDYGIYGLLLLIFYRYMKGHTMVLAHLGLNFLYCVLFSAPIQLYSIIPTLVFAYLSASSAVTGYSAPRWLWRSFYPVHLLALYILSTIILSKP
jgi:hypothetical protein